MAQYQVPQFIEVEDKIFGPLTIKQFVYLAGAGGLALICFTVLPLLLALPLGAIAVGIGAAFAFYQVNGRPLIVAAEHAFSYILGHKLYLWKQRQAPAQVVVAKQTTPEAGIMSVPRLSQSRLKDLSWSLNIKDQEPPKEEANTPRGLQI